MNNGLSNNLQRITQRHRKNDVLSSFDYDIHSSSINGCYSISGSSSMTDSSSITGLKLDDYNSNNSNNSNNSSNGTQHSSLSTIDNNIPNNIMPTIGAINHGAMIDSSNNNETNPVANNGNGNKNGNGGYKCNQCSKVFVRKVNLNAHKKIHTAFAYLCPFCNKVYLYIYIYIIYMIYNI